eukprot:m.14394 g.14394  ORF g.14394 m.14394 type:complete len:105 (+) comp25723_c0_seq3:451-765(+)
MVRGKTSSWLLIRWLNVIESFTVIKLELWDVSITLFFRRKVMDGASQCQLLMFRQPFLTAIMLGATVQTGHHLVWKDKCETLYLRTDAGHFDITHGHDFAAIYF